MKAEKSRSIPQISCLPRSQSVSHFFVRCLFVTISLLDHCCARVIKRKICLILWPLHSSAPSPTLSLYVRNSASTGRIDRPITCLESEWGHHLYTFSLVPHLVTFH